jgi:hypothetical protein
MLELSATIKVTCAANELAASALPCFSASSEPPCSAIPFIVRYPRGFLNISHSDSLKLLASFVYSESLDLNRSNSCLLGRLGSPQLDLLSFNFVPKTEISFLGLHDLHLGQQIFSCAFVNSSNLLLQFLHSNSKIGMGYSF